MEGLGELLRDWRLARGLTQVQAAEVCGMTRALWSMIEGGRRLELRDESYEKLAAGTGLSQDHLRRASVRSQMLKLQALLNPVTA